MFGQVRQVAAQQVKSVIPDYHVARGNY